MPLLSAIVFGNTENIRENIHDTMEMAANIKPVFNFKVAE